MVVLMVNDYKLNCRLGRSFRFRSILYILYVVEFCDDSGWQLDFFLFHIRRGGAAVEVKTLAR